MKPANIQTVVPSKLLEEKGFKKKKLCLQPLNTSSCNMFNEDLSVQSPTAIYHNSSEPISKINDYLFLGSLQGAKDKTALKKFGITHIINISSINDTNFYENEFKYLNIDIKDSHEEDIKRFFPTLVQYIESAKDQQGKIFVHCYAGISRGPSVAISYFIWKRGITYQEAYRVVKDARATISPNAGFVYKLLEWENDCKQEKLFKEQAVVVVPTTTATAATIPTKVVEKTIFTLPEKKISVAISKVEIIIEKEEDEDYPVLSKDTELGDNLSAVLERSMSFEDKKRKRDPSGDENDLKTSKKKQRLFEVAEFQENIGCGELERTTSSDIQRTTSDVTISVY